MFVAYYCEGCNAAPLTQNRKIEIKQELTKENYYFGDDSDEESSSKKMRLRVFVYSQAEYWYASTNKGYTMTYKDYSIAKDDNIAA